MEEIIASLKRYEEKGIPCGGFLNAFLENDLMKALGRADDLNRLRLYEIGDYIYNKLPLNIWGSPEKVKAHLDSKL